MNSTSAKKGLSQNISGISRCFQISEQHAVEIKFERAKKKAWGGLVMNTVMLQLVDSVILKGLNFPPPPRIAIYLRRRLEVKRAAVGQVPTLNA